MFGFQPLPRTLEASVRDIASTRPPVRTSAIADLVRHARLGDKARERAIPLLEKALRDDVNAVRSAAALALADLHAESALPALIVAVEDPDAYVRQMALTALGEIGDARARQRIERALHDERPEVRYQALIAFVRIAEGDDADRRAAIEKALDDGDANIRHIALRLAEEHHVAGVEDKARSVLADADRAVAIVAAMIVARVRDPEGEKTLLGFIASGTGAHREDEQAAVELAGELGLTAAIPDLERRAWGLGRVVRDTCAWHAKIALARLGNERAVAEITADLGSWRRETRDAAVVAAGRARLASVRRAIAATAERGGDPRLIAEALELIGGPKP
jgi:HEAT repeat protein